MTKNNSEFTIFRMWMSQELGLGGNDLLVYAFIYKYSIGKLGFYYGGYAHIQLSTGGARSTVIRSLQRLMDTEMIFRKTKVSQNGLERHYYRINFEKLENIDSEDLKEALIAGENTETNWENCLDITS